MEKYTVAILTDEEGNTQTYYTYSHVNKSHFKYYVLGTYHMSQIVDNGLKVGDIDYPTMVEMHTVKVTHMTLPTVYTTPNTPTPVNPPGTRI